VSLERCRVCNDKLVDDGPELVCERCRRKLGIVDMPPPRRQPTPCIKCGGTALVRVIPRDHTIAPGEVGESVAVPMRLSVMPKTTPSFFMSRGVAEAPTPSSGRGMLEAYVCRGCGFVEWYCSDPENIPIGPEFMTEAINADGNPYR
jgi:hypothetical protein